MPQMMPINWMISFLLFIIIFNLFNILNYYIFNYNYKNYSSKILINNNNNLFWKW